MVRAMPWAFAPLVLRTTGALYLSELVFATVGALEFGILKILRCYCTYALN